MDLIYDIESNTFKYDKVEEFCKQTNNKESCVEITNRQLREIENEHSYMETSTFYNIFSFFTQRDQTALATSRFFGIEANYNDVPRILREDIPSTICLAKIDGYLDKEKANQDGRVNGGVTSYSYELDQDPRAGVTGSNLVVDYDLRAQRTAILPDNSSQIVYSFFLRAPADTELTYALRVGYQVGNEKVKVIVTDFKTF